MSDNELPKLSPEAEREASISLAVGNCISRGYDKISEDLDDLHKRGFTDDDIVKALREQGETDILDWYAEWADIDLREDDNTTTNPVVPDPGDAPSYASLSEVRVPPGHTRFYPEAGGILDIPDHLVDTFRKGGAE